MKLHILTGDGKRAEDVVVEMAARIKDVIYDYAGKATVATAVGVLHIVAREIMEEAE